MPMPGQSPSNRAVSRRTLLRRSGALAAGVAGAAATAGTGLGPLASRAYADPLDFTSRAVFDSYDQQFHAGGYTGQPDQTNEAGALAWGQSYVLIGFIRMYDAYQDTYYLDRLIHNADLVLAGRDSERGVTDYRGQSLPAWRAANPYTVAAVELPDADGRPALEVRCARSGAEGATATITHEDDGRFTLAVTHPTGGTTTYEHLTLDPQSADLASKRVYGAYSMTTMITAREPGGTGTSARPAAGTYRLVAEPVIFSVHTGMITYPLAAFARTVLSTPSLRSNPRYRSKAAEYVQAVRDAIAVHDHEWVQSNGIGYFRWLKGTPLPYDGNPLPINQTTAIGRTLVELAAATGERTYAVRAAAIARMFKAQISRDAGDASIWYYWPTDAPIWKGYAATGNPDTDVSLYTPTYRNSSGAGAQQVDDCSHAAISVDFAGLARQAGIVFGDTDLRAIGRTFGDNLATTGDDGIPTVFTRLDGTGVAPSGQYLQAPRWIRAAWWDSRVHEQSKAIYQARQPAPGLGSGLCGIASLNWYARQGGRPLPKI
ncbi:hypothetical protein [Flindersiella endophytica]